jgi:hypothetical protein
MHFAPLSRARPANALAWTFHQVASRACITKHHVQHLLTGDPMIGIMVDTRAGAAVGPPRNITELRSAAFVRPDRSSWFEHARNCISAVLACGFGCKPPKVLGVIHPSSARPFDRRLLPDIPFCCLRFDYSQGRFATEWI